MSIEPNAFGDLPRVAATAFVHPTAVLIGNVSIGQRCYVGPNAVIRADEPGPDERVAPISIGDDSNVQDCVVIHALKGRSVRVGPRTSLAHGSIIHGPCEIGAACFIGFGAVVFHSTLGEGVLVMHRALVEGATLGDRLLVPAMTAIQCQADAGDLQPPTEEQTAFADAVVRTNLFLAEAGLRLSVGRAVPDRRNG